MSDEIRTFAVVGLGNFGATIARELVRFGDTVIGIDADDARVNGIADELDQSLILDARNEDALREAGVEKVDAAVVSLGNDIEASVIATMNLTVIGVPKIWAKAVSKTHHRILTKIGAHRVIRPEVRVATQMAQILHNPLIRDHVSLGNNYHVVNLRVPEALQERSLEDLDLEDFDLRCLGVMRGTKFVGRDGAPCTLETDDMLLLLGRRTDLRAFTSSL